MAFPPRMVGVTRTSPVEPSTTIFSAVFWVAWTELTSVTGGGCARGRGEHLRSRRGTARAASKRGRARRPRGAAPLRSQRECLRRAAVPRLGLVLAPRLRASRRGLGLRLAPRRPPGRAPQQAGPERLEEQIRARLTVRNRELYTRQLTRTQAARECASSKCAAKCRAAPAAHPTVYLLHGVSREYSISNKRNRKSPIRRSALAEAVSGALTPRNPSGHSSSQTLSVSDLHSIFQNGILRNRMGAAAARSGAPCVPTATPGPWDIPPAIGDG